MGSSKVVKTLRLLFILGLLFAMPMLALPPVLKRFDALMDASIGQVAPSPTSPVARIPAAKASPAIVPVARDPVAKGPAPQPKLREKRVEVVAYNKPLASDKNERIQTIQQRLKELGANYMVLEAAPQTEQGYRFLCRMPIPGSSVYSRPFEVFDPDPLQAMERVLSSVETWQSSRKDF